MKVKRYILRNGDDLPKGELLYIEQAYETEWGYEYIVLWMIVDTKQ